MHPHGASGSGARADIARRHTMGHRGCPAQREARPGPSPAPALRRAEDPLLRLAVGPRCRPLHHPRAPRPRCLSSERVAALLAPTFSISRSPAGRSNEPPGNWPHAIVCAPGRGRVSAARWRVTTRAAAPLASHLLPAPGRRARAWPSPPRGRVLSWGSTW